MKPTFLEEEKKLTTFFFQFLVFILDTLKLFVIDPYMFVSLQRNTSQ